MSKIASEVLASTSAEPTASARFEPCGVVSLLTDFGLVDPYVGMLKAVILAHCPTAKIVDVTHGVPAQDVRVGAFFLARAWRYFPRGSVHLAVVDPGVGSARKILVAVRDGHAFVGPDNGLLASSLGADAIVGELSVERFAAASASHTFHGRDVMAPAVAALASGLAFESTLRARVASIVAAPFAAPRRLPDGSLEVEVLVADHYGNLILACAPEALDGPLESWRVVVAGRELAFARTYAQVDPGELLALVDSFPAVEIAVRDGSARATLGIDRGDRVNLRKIPC